MAENESEAELTASEIETIRKLLVEKMRWPVACELCGNNGWTFWNTMLTMVRFKLQKDDNSGAVDYKRLHPNVVISCDHCGNTKFVNAQILGVEKVVQAAAAADE